MEEKGRGAGTECPQPDDLLFQSKKIIRTVSRYDDSAHSQIARPGQARDEMMQNCKGAKLWFNTELTTNDFNNRIQDQVSELDVMTVSSDPV